MRVLVLILFLSLTLVSCADFQLFDDLESKIDAPIAKPSSLPILEITQNAIGMWQITGKILNFRLYDNGFVEFETLDKSKIQSPLGSITTDEIKVMNQTQVSATKLKKIMDLVNSESFLNLKDSYSRKCCCTDAQMNYEINFKYGNTQKKVWVSSCGDMVSSDSPNYPDLPEIIPLILYGEF